MFAVTLFQAAEPTGAAAILESLLFAFKLAPPTRIVGPPADAQRSLVKYRERDRLFKIEEHLNEIRDAWAKHFPSGSH